MRLHTASLVALAAMAAAACQKDNAANNSATQAGAPAAAAAPTVVTAHAKDFAFDIPDSVAAGTITFKLVNDGPNFHHMQIVRLDSGKTVADMSAAMSKPGAPPPAWLSFVGGPNAPDPKSESNATVTLTPGNYAAICLVDM